MPSGAVNPTRPDRAPRPRPRYSRPPLVSPATNPEYELVLMLDPEAPDERRDQIAADARKRIETGGTLKHDTAWGMRKLAYEIKQRTEADYRLFRFETDGPVLDELNHNLKIADGVLRFRIFKVDPRAAVAAPPATTAPSARPRRTDDGARQEAEAPPAAEAEAPAPPPAEPEAEAPPAAEPEAEAPPEPAEPPEGEAPPPDETT
jgi:small subunit ribosomal protein S6